MSLLEIKNLHVTVDGKPILKGIDLSVSAGEVHAIMGPNGSGKSTLALVMAGRQEYEITEGQILYNGEDLTELDPEAVGAVEKACGEAGFTHRRMWSAAGHDARYAAEVCPTAMIFVPGEHDGISHDPREQSTKQQCADGVNVLLETVMTLAGPP